MYTFEKKNKQCVLKIKATKEEWDRAVDASYEKNKSRYNIQGFRKGKAPKKVIEQNYGDTVFFDDAFDMIISEEYSKFLSENKDVVPVSQPRVDMNSFTIDKGLEATLIFDLMPEFSLPDLSKIKVSKDEIKVTEEDVLKEIENERVAHARFVEEDKEAGKGDYVTIDFTGFVEGNKFDGGEAKDYKLELGSHTFIEGFEDQLIGLKKGDEKDVNVVFPSDYHADNLKGKPAVFKIIIKKIERKVLPEINDKYVSDTTEFETLEEYKKSIKENLTKIAEERIERSYEVKLLDAIADKSDIQVPQSMIDHEVHHIIEDFEHRLSHQGMTLDSYLQYVGKTLDDFKKERTDDAEKNIRTRLVLQKLISENNISITSDELDKSINDYAQKYQMTVEDFKKAMSPDDYAYFENSAMMMKVLNFIKSKVN